MILPVVLKVVDIGLAVAERVVEWNDKRKAKERAAKRWAETPATIRGCPHCHEINYTPAAVSCRACGRLL